MRGVSHHAVIPLRRHQRQGIDVVPLSAIPLEHKSSSLRATLGNAGLDRMCNGGPFRDSTILVSGPTGAGKTLMATEFAAGGAAAGERCLFLGFEESRDQLFRNAASWGYNFTQIENDGLLQVLCEYPESTNLDDRLIHLKEIMGQFRPHRIVLDNLSRLDASPPKRASATLLSGLRRLSSKSRFLHCLPRRSVRSSVTPKVTKASLRCLLTRLFCCATWKAAVRCVTA